MKHRLDTFYTRIISFFLALLGFGVCNETKAQVMIAYGTPSYTFKGKVVSEDRQEPIEGIEVVLENYQHRLLREFSIIPDMTQEEKDKVIERTIEAYEKGESCTEYISKNDTIYTNAQGEFDFKCTTDYSNVKVKIKLTDVDGNKNGAFEDVYEDLDWDAIKRNETKIIALKPKETEA